MPRVPQVELPLYEPPFASWQGEYDKLMRDPYLAKKYSRAARIREKTEFLHTFTPRILEAPGGLVVDIGPGPGEYLELCRHYGCQVFGVDAPNGVGGMGYEYWRLSQLMHQRQRLHVSYEGWQALVDGDYPSENSVYMFVSQGSWAQAYSDHLDGTPHHVNHNANEQRWRFSADLLAAWARAFIWMRSRLVDGGRILIYDNKTGDESDQLTYRMGMHEAARIAGLSLAWSRSPTLNCWRKG